MKTTKLIMLLMTMICIWSCTNDSENDLIEIEQEEGADADVTYNNTIAAVMQTSCVGCHANPPVNGAPFALVNFQQVSGRANAVLTAMSRQSGAAAAMPPSGRLAQNTINQIQAWIDSDLPEN